MTVATREHSVDLAKRPNPTKPTDLTLGAELGTFSGGTVITEAMEKGLKVLLGDGNRNLTAKRIDAMRLDYQVSACLAVLIQPMLRADWVITCEDDDIAEWTRQAHEPIHVDLMRAVSRATWAGRAPSVLVWDYADDIGGLVVKKLRDLPPLSCLPITDADGGYAGIWQNKGAGTDEVKIDEVLQTLWVVEGMESGNLLGRSLLAAALDPFLDKAATRLFRARYLERFGEPAVVVSYPDGQQPTNQAEINAAIAANKLPPDLQYVPNRDIALNVGNGLRHHSVVGLPSEQYVNADGKAIGPKWKIDYLEAARSGGSDFQTAIDDADRAIARGMFVPDLTFSNTDSGAYALGKEHRSVFDASMEGRLDDYARQVSRHYLNRMVRLNYGDNAPKVALEFVGITDTDREKRWALATELVAKGALSPDVQQLADDLGIPLLEGTDDAAPAQGAELAANPFSNVGLPALIAAGVITEQEGREMLGIEGTAPGKAAPIVVTPPPADPAEQDAQEGQDATQEPDQDSEADLARPAPAVTLATRGATGDATALPGYTQPQAAAPRGPWARDLTPRERPMTFAKIESAMDTAEATAVDALCALLGASRDRVMAQVKGIMSKPTLAEVLAAVSTLNVGATTAAAAAWESLLREVWLVGLASSAEQLPEYAEKMPTNLGPEARAQAKALAGVNAARHYAVLGSTLQLAMLNAVTSGTSLAGVQNILAGVYDAELTSEARAARLATRMLSALALNEGRRDAVERGGVPIRGAQYSAILDRRTCDLCERQDEMVVAIESPDLRQYTPPVHHNCRCVWVWITRDELDFTPTWTTPPPSLVTSHGSLVVG